LKWAGPACAGSSSPRLFLHAHIGSPTRRRQKTELQCDPARYCLTRCTVLSRGEVKLRTIPRTHLSPAAMAWLRSRNRTGHIRRPRRTSPGQRSLSLNLVSETPRPRQGRSALRGARGGICEASRLGSRERATGGSHGPIMRLGQRGDDARLSFRSSLVGLLGDSRGRQRVGFRSSG
jgi:hypothetical protein